jgi:hypothetical protein
LIKKITGWQDGLLVCAVSSRECGDRNILLIFCRRIRGSIFNIHFTPGNIWGYMHSPPSRLETGMDTT